MKKYYYVCTIQHLETNPDQNLQEFDGWLYGHFDNIKEMSGSDLTFVYDDFTHVLRGRWHRGVMVRARRDKIRCGAIQRAF